jgi:hypothetical protein
MPTTSRPPRPVKPPPQPPVREPMPEVEPWELPSGKRYEGPAHRPLRPTQQQTLGCIDAALAHHSRSTIPAPRGARA